MFRSNSKNAEVVLLLIVLQSLCCNEQSTSLNPSFGEFFNDLRSSANVFASGSFSGSLLETEKIKLNKQNFDKTECVRHVNSSYVLT